MRRSDLPTSRMRGAWKRMKSKRESMFGGHPEEFERFCTARDMLGVVMIHDAIRLLVDFYLDHADDDKK